METTLDIKQMPVRRHARLEKLETALRQIARTQIMDSVSAIRMRAIAASALLPEDNRP